MPDLIRRDRVIRAAEEERRAVAARERLAAAVAAEAEARAGREAARNAQRRRERGEDLIQPGVIEARGETWLGPGPVRIVLGRDALSRVLFGGREILALAALATAIGIIVGTALGVTAGYVRGLVDETIMRTLDVALAFPQIILALLLVSIVGPKLWLVCLAVAAIHAPQVARVTRAATLRTVEQDFVKYAESFGIPRRVVMVREIVPNIISPVMVETGLRLTYSIAIIASLSFLGFGLQPPDADWGLMVNENRIGIQQNPWPVVAPIVLIAIVTVGANMFSDAIARSALGIEAPIAPPTMAGSEGDPIGGADPAVGGGAAAT